MKTVLIVSPRFPPINAADHHRVRMMLPTLAERGWHAVVLAVDPDFIEGTVEPDLLLTIPDDVEVVHTRAWPQRLTRRLGFGSLSLRSRRSLKSAGDKLLKSGRFDLIFFSTTEFGVISLGRHWKRRFGVPFIVDLQDPWVNPHYEETGSRPPGGAFKHRVTQAIAGIQEGRTLRDAAHVISVSPRYSEVLRARYRYLSASDFSVIPFGGSRFDFKVSDAIGQKQSIFSPSDGRRHWLYAGTAPPGARLAVTSFLLALRQACADGILEEDSVRIHFVGTDYAPPALLRPQVTPIVKELGMDRMVTEHPARIPYLETLRCLRDADALLVFGWDDPGYTASKLYPYILADKPLLSILHEDSSANEVMQNTRAGVSVCFNGKTSVREMTDQIFQQWFVTRAFEAPPSTSWEAFRPYSASEMTRRVTDVFARVAG